ncbi:class I SAM-dependent methyltransferase [Proteobacteria bacterium 005FR1]|nr:class I SAM-dependent methyltransferase [Proteobacteria bacterium 005FR1]
MWDERYSTEEYVYGTAPNDFLAAHVGEIPKGKVLCLGEGEGRNAVFLATQRYQVTAVDQSAVGLEKARRLAQSRGVSIDCIQADLADFDPGENQWDGIVAIFCHLPSPVRRRLHQRIPAALKPNGVFVLEAYTPRQLEFGTGGPPTADLLISANDLRSEICGLNFLHLEETERDVVEGHLHTGRASVVQVIASKALRRFSFSSHRGGARHKVRYVESGGGDSDENCRICQPGIKPRE